MEIIVSKEIGFCFGVKQALNSVKENLNKMPRPIRMYGFLIHNEEVVKGLCNLGIEIVDDLRKINEGTLIITAHGISPKLKTQLQKRINLTILDTTCPKVSAIHRMVQKLNEEKRVVIVFGDSNHQEVKGIKGASGKNALVISSADEALNLKIDKNKKYGLVAQTTQDTKTFDKIKTIIKERIPEVKIINTICNTTYKRQSEIKEIALKTDIVLVIGSKRSANTRRLYEISFNVNKNTYYISGSREIENRWFKGKKSVGIGAGASTPDEIIKEVIERIKKDDKKNDKKKKN